LYFELSCADKLDAEHETIIGQGGKSRKSARELFT
jgi:hypothetical protein